MWKTKMTGLCKNDRDCPRGQYCYDHSTCVNFTQCTSFNREETAVPARNGFQCGPCLNGFYKNDQSEVFCQKTEILMNSGNNLEIIWIILYTFVALIILLSLLSVIYIVYAKMKRRAHCITSLPINKKYSEIDEKKVIFHHENELKPTAPQEGNDVCNQLVEEKKEFCQHNNKEAIVNNESQKASPFRPPNWVNNGTSSNYNAQSSTQCTTAPRVYRLPAARNDSDINEQLALLPEQTVEHEDNARNTALIQASCSSSDNNTSSTDSTTFNNNGNDGNNNRNGDDARTNSVVINQNITMNWNMTNLNN